MPRPKQEVKFILDDFLPTESVHLIAGPSGAGKTTWLMQFLAQWQHQLPILGMEDFVSYPCPWIYLAADRGGPATWATIDRLGLGKELPENRIWTWDDFDRPQSRLNLQEFLHRLLPNGGLAVVDGLNHFVEDENLRMHVKEFVRKLRMDTARLKITVLGAVSTTKWKANENYVLSRERISGSGAWGQNCDSIILMQPSDKDNDKRIRMDVLPRNGREYNRFLIRDKQGALISSYMEGEISGDDILEMNLMTLDIGVPIRTQEIHAWWGDDSERKRSTTERWIGAKVESGELEFIRKGMYRKTGNRHGGSECITTYSK